MNPNEFQAIESGVEPRVEKTLTGTLIGQDNLNVSVGKRRVLLNSNFKDRTLVMSVGGVVLQFGS